MGCGVDRTSSGPLSLFLGICSYPPRLEPVLAPFLFLRGQSGLARGAGPPVLVGGGGAVSARRGSVSLAAASPARSWRSWLPLPASGGAIRPAVRPPPPVCSARRPASGGGRAARAFGADVSASRAISRETLLHGDGLPGRRTPFLWAWAAAARSAGTDGGGWGE